ncbi:MAG: glutaredoxin family protein [Ignavibacteriae bacterium]|nr:glutaredoxin family protein [Ignavibacteriota bacterium]
MKTFTVTDLTLEKEPAQMKNIVVYTAEWCPDCRRAKRYLEDQKIFFSEIDIEETEGAAEQIIEWSGGRRVIPTFNINGTILHNPPLELLKEAIRQCHGPN